MCFGWIKGEVVSWDPKGGEMASVHIVVVPPNHIL